MEKPQNHAQLQAMLQIVSSKLGIPADTLRQELQAGKFDKAIAGMNPQEAFKFKQVLDNPQLLNKMMNSRQAKALYEKLTGKS